MPLDRDAVVRRLHEIPEHARYGMTAIYLIDRSVAEAPVLAMPAPIAVQQVAVAAVTRSEQAPTPVAPVAEPTLLDEEHGDNVAYIDQIRRGVEAIHNEQGDASQTEATLATLHHLDRTHTLAEQDGANDAIAA